MQRPTLRVISARVATVPPKSADPFYLSDEWKGIRAKRLAMDGGSCVMCGSRASVVDHITRRRDGGPDDISNLRSLCRACDARLKEDWAGRRPESPRGGGG